jgi:hypothetical protein
MTALNTTPTPNPTPRPPCRGSDQENGFLSTYNIQTNGRPSIHAFEVNQASCPTSPLPEPKDAKMETEGAIPTKIKAISEFLRDESCMESHLWWGQVWVGCMFDRFGNFVFGRHRCRKGIHGRRGKRFGCLRKECFLVELVECPERIDPIACPISIDTVLVE